LEVAGIPGFLVNLDDFYAASDAEGQSWRDFVEAWHHENQGRPKRTSELNTFCNENDLLMSVRGSKSERSQETRLGCALQSVQDRVFKGFRIALDHDAKGRGKWYKLVPVRLEGSDAV
jgi:hypothetical protein